MLLSLHILCLSLDFLKKPHPCNSVWFIFSYFQVLEYKKCKNGKNLSEKVSLGKKIQSQKNMDTHITSLSLTNHIAEKPNEIKALNNALRQIKQTESLSDCCSGPHFHVF